MKAAPFARTIGVAGLALAALAVSAQSRPPTTEQLGKDPGALRQEAERQRAQERAQQQQGSQQQADQQWNDTLRQQQSRAANDAAQGEAVRRSWAQRPPLAPEQNPLLGRWESLGPGQRGNAAGLPPELAKMAAELIGGVTSGLCDSMLGRGPVEFRPAGVFAIGRDGRERAMYRAEYRGGSSRVVVLPQGGTTFTHMIIDFDRKDRATVAAVGCRLARVGGGEAGAAMVKSSLSMDPGAGPALQWNLLGTSVANGGMDLYVARSTIRRSGASVHMTDLWDFKTPHKFERRTFLSARNEYEYDCARSRRRMVSTTGFSGHMGQGTVVGSDAVAGPWEPVASSGVFHDYWKVACAR